MSRTAKMLGIVIPVVVATTFCLTVPFIILVADAAILGAAILVFVSERMSQPEITEDSLPDLE